MYVLSKCQGSFVTDKQTDKQAGGQIDFAARAHRARNTVCQ